MGLGRLVGGEPYHLYPVYGNAVDPFAGSSNLESRIMETWLGSAAQIAQSM